MSLLQAIFRSYSLQTVSEGSVDALLRLFYWGSIKSLYGSFKARLRLYHPRMADDSGIFTTTGRILFYNSWKETCAKLQLSFLEFHQWLIHENNKHSGTYHPSTLVSWASDQAYSRPGQTLKKPEYLSAFYCPYSLVPDPNNFLNSQKLWVVCHRWVVKALFRIC
jgi:hypothetical protein